MRPHHRLDLLWLPDDPDRALHVDAFAALEAEWAGGGAFVWGANNLPLGASAVRLDDPGRIAFYGNQMGGFRVSCPETGGNLVPQFVAAMGAWRRGEGWTMACPACGAAHRLPDLVFRPQAAFARGAILFADVQTTEVPPDLAAALDRVTGPSLRVLRRPS